MTHRNKSDTRSSDLLNDLLSSEVGRNSSSVAQPSAPLTEAERVYLSELFSKYRSPLHRYLSGLLSSQDDVAEMVQETYFRIMRRSSAIQFETITRGYLFATATNLAREHYRRRATRRVDAHLPLEEAEAVSDKDVPEEVLIWNEAIQQVRAGLKAMPRELREVLVLSRFQQQTYPQISVTLGISLRTVERRVRQAIEFLAISTRDSL